MRTFSYQDSHEEAVTSVNACVVYHLWRWRNSWGGSESLNYRASDHFAGRADEQAMATTLVGAKKQAEKWRAPGSVFHIRELPSLVVRAGSTQMVFAEVNANEPFADWTPDLALIGQPLRITGLELWQYGEGGWDRSGRLRATLEDDELPEAIAPSRVFRDWTSSPAGAKGNQLGWSGRPSRTSASAVVAIAMAFTAVQP